MSDLSFFKLRQYLDSYCDWLCAPELSDDDFHPKNVQSFLNVHLPKTFDESERDLPAIVFCDRLITRIVASNTNEQIRSFWEARLAGNPLTGRSSSSARKHFANRIAIELWSLNHDRRLPEIKVRESSPSPPSQLIHAFGLSDDLAARYYRFFYDACMDETLVDIAQRRNCSREMLRKVIKEINQVMGPGSARNTWQHTLSRVQEVIGVYQPPPASASERIRACLAEHLSLRPRLVRRFCDRFLKAPIDAPGTSIRSLADSLGYTEDALRKLTQEINHARKAYGPPIPWQQTVRLARAILSEHHLDWHDYECSAAPGISSDAPLQGLDDATD